MRSMCAFVGVAQFATKPSIDMDRFFSEAGTLSQCALKWHGIVQSLSFALVSSVSTGAARVLGNSKAKRASVSHGGGDDWNALLSSCDR